MNNTPDFELWQYTWEVSKTKNERALAMKGHFHVLQPYSSLGNWGKEKVKSLKAEDRLRVTAEKWTQYQIALLNSFPV